MPSSSRPIPHDAPPGRERPTRRVSRRVFYPAAALVLGFVLLAAIAPSPVKAALAAANAEVVKDLGWYYVLIVTGFVAFSLYAGLSRWGNVRLGPDDELPAYGLRSWFAMLFAAGMGIGLVYWGVAEPLNHYAAAPPGVPADTVAQRAQGAMSTTFLHWGLHAWAIYVVVGLAIALAVHRRGRPVSLRWALEPLFGDRVKGRLGDVVDVVAIVGTLFGVATSLGFGVSQLGAGLELLGLGTADITMLLVLVAVITALATLSVASGLDVGIKWLSNANLALAALLLLALLVLGPSLFLLRGFVQNIGAYLQGFIGLSFRTMPYQGERGQLWLDSWTTYYWGWWMSWSPFVGIFIARISRGRTVREFVGGVLLVPSLVTFLWFSVLGGSAIYQEMSAGGGLVAADGSVDTSTALFRLLDHLPAASLLCGLFLLLVAVFFVTSSDSGSFVVDMLACGGDENPPVATRVFWALMQGAIAAVLLWVGAQRGALTDGLAALQTMSILVAAPLSVLLIGMCVASARVLHRAVARTPARTEPTPSGTVPALVPSQRHERT